MHERFNKAVEARIIPVVAIHDAQWANPLADALIEGGLPCAEITFRTSAASRAIRAMSARGDMIVGAGTVLTIDQVKEAVDSGACFIVSPGFNPKVVAYCVNQNIPVTPGTCTPTDIEAALELGLKTVKFFPAEAFGGVRTLKALSGPYGMMRFIPTGGIGPHNLVEYLQLPGVAACGGSWMVESGLISKGQFDRVTQLTREAVALARDLSKKLP